MTCIAGWIEDGQVWLGGDSSEAAGTTQFLRNHPKVFSRSEGGIKWLMAISGIARASQLLQYELEFPSSEGFDESDICGFVVTKLVPGIRELFSKHGFLKRKEGMDEMDGPIMVGVKGHLLTIDPLFFVREVPEKYATMGSGGAVARGVLWTLSNIEIKENLTPKERLLKALLAAEECTTSVSHPFHVISTSEM